MTSSPHAVSAAPISVAVADDHPAALEHCGGFTGGARAGTGAEVSGLVERDSPQVLPLDLMLGGQGSSPALQNAGAGDL